jgi:hypothetical protein
MFKIFTLNTDTWQIVGEETYSDRATASERLRYLQIGDTPGIRYFLRGI